MRLVDLLEAIGMDSESDEKIRYVIRVEIGKYMIHFMSAQSY